MKLTDEERGRRQGIGWALAEAVRFEGCSHVMAEEMYGAAGWTVAQYQTAGVEEYDLKEIRKIARYVKL